MARIPYPDPSQEFTRLTQGFTSRVIVEVLLTIGYYTMLARFTTVLAIDVEEPAGERLLALPSSEGRKGS